ncbi:MAG: adaptor protein MecA [Atopostipes suicloacalis]|uniref:adaptor protein MecA n=1 Tax=Alkalibacterium sp. TaxID=1872447 RepID=UPI00264910B0|nr:adaptor protein MecA [Alkalibacterium sp.]MDN6293158.1 adaptor protein MecA [Alkalibacterium sp.]MDN6294938.1 adaptor protein MecA [Alkalibacterium sp.]MDN6731835.1 adaptor protein MecA [Atopostipes suicloacalis]
MEIEHINEDTIRVTIENTDLEERGVTFLDLLGNQKQIEKFFYSILEEVDIDEEFQESEAVTFQVMPNSNGLELFISKGANFKENSNSLSALKNKLTLNQDEQSSDEMNDYQKENNQTKEAVVTFDSFEKLLALSKNLYLESGLSTLYSYKDMYYLHIVFFVEEMVQKTSDEELAIVLEFGENTKTTPEVLSEYAKLLMKSNALEQARYYFK